MSEQNKVLARKVYEIIASGDLGRLEEIVDPNMPDNERPECPPEMGTPRPKLIDTFREFATEAHRSFPDMRIEVEDMITEGDKVSARVPRSPASTAFTRTLRPHTVSPERRAVPRKSVAFEKYVTTWKPSAHGHRVN